MLETSNQYSFQMSYNAILFRECFQKVFDQEVSVLSDYIEPQLYLKIQLKGIMHNLLTDGYSICENMYHNSAYYVMQGIIENALAKAKYNGLTHCVTAYIVDPVMPAPLRMDASQRLEKLEIDQPLFGPRYRINALESFLSSANILKLMYCKDAWHVISTGDEAFWQNYQGVVKNNKNSLEEYVFTNLSCSEFPTTASCAVYEINNMNIVFGSELVETLIPCFRYQPYILLGEHGNNKVGQLNQFFEDHPVERI